MQGGYAVSIVHRGERDRLDRRRASPAIRGRLRPPCRVGRFAKLARPVRHRFRAHPARRFASSRSTIRFPAVVTALGRRSRERARRDGIHWRTWRPRPPESSVGQGSAEPSDRGDPECGKTGTRARPGKKGRLADGRTDVHAGQASDRGLTGRRGRHRPLRLGARGDASVTEARQECRIANDRPGVQSGRPTARCPTGMGGRPRRSDSACGSSRARAKSA